MTPEQAAEVITQLKLIADYVQLGFGALLGMLLAQIIYAFFRGAVK
jgi:hypothetical protein